MRRLLQYYQPHPLPPGKALPEGGFLRPNRCPSDRGTGVSSGSDTAPPSTCDRQRCPGACRPAREKSESFSLLARSMPMRKNGSPEEHRVAASGTDIHSGEPNDVAFRVTRDWLRSRRSCASARSGRTAQSSTQGAGTAGMFVPEPWRDSIRRNRQSRFALRLREVSCSGTNGRLVRPPASRNLSARCVSAPADTSSCGPPAVSAAS
jgi:hypothetical protein